MFFVPPILWRKEANFRTGETRGAKLEASTGEAKRAAELSDKKIQDKGGAQVSLFTDSAFFDGLLWLREAIFFSSQSSLRKEGNSDLLFHSYRK